MLKIDRSAVDEAIKNMNMFTATLEVIASYEAEKKVLKERGEFLTQKLEQLQEQQVTLLMDRETANDSPSDYVYLSKQLKEIEEEVKILLPLHEQLKEEFTELKKKYMPIIQSTYKEDSAKRNSYFNVSEAVTSVKEVVKGTISDYEGEIHKQDKQVMAVIYAEFLDDAELMDESWDDPVRRKKALAFKRAFDFDRLALYYDKTIDLR